MLCSDFNSCIYLPSLTCCICVQVILSSTVDEQCLSDGDLEYPHKDPDKKTNALYVICLCFVVFL